METNRPMERGEQPGHITRKEKRVGVAIIVALLIIAGTAIYFVASENSQKKEVTAEKIRLEQEFKNLSKTLDAKTAELEDFRGKNAELDKEISARQADIEAQKKQIAGLLSKGKLTNAELSRTKAMIAQYELSIAELQQKVDALTTQNQQLTAQNEQLNTDLSAQRETTTKQNEQIAGLSKKVEVGSLLHLENLDVVAVKERRNGKEVPVKKAKNAEALKISFETGENKVIDPGTLPLYVRVINPRGETIATGDQGSGALKVAGTDETVQFTKEADIEYDQSSKKVSVYWNQGIKDPGTYKVEVYQNGYLIGKDELALN